MTDKLKREEKQILLFVPILFIAGSLLHFLYELSGENHVIALFSAVNESVWEHKKLAVFPTVLFWVIFFLVKGKKYSVDKNKWFTGALGSVLTMMIVMPAVYYFYTGAFGIEILWVDILILLLADALGQLVGLHLYRYAEGIEWYISLLILFMIILLFGVFTYCPPQLPVFTDSETGLLETK